ncbi:DUF72 domain-containing protein [Rhizobium sp. BK399]|uniref:DUF72 domain-containing protein n=1 Tax=Rhizobium sp. BK399 TaxID=2587063 RepID=UPI00161F87EB|nr:DUF72 domain-containing protein [Rhizobium sp. BK399]MBB3543916.1 uncharacterized protein YecE (DUF72 family) [Rhizobium sp. BK399]
MGRTGRIRIGISGWTYKPWRGTFYPDKLPQSQELAYASRRFQTIEVNGTFYGLQKPEAFQLWRDTTPENFVFSIKGSRYITHMLRLKNIETPLANFVASGPLRLGSKLGPILWQFPPSFKFDENLFDHFLRILPKNTEDAAALAKRHDERLRSRCWLECEDRQPLRHAVEIRHDSFRSERFIELLRKYGVALVCADSREWPLLMDVTADFIYCRLHGSDELYVSGYDDDALETWAGRIHAWAHGGEPDNVERLTSRLPRSKAGRDVYVYFDNDVKVRAPADARSLATRLDVVCPDDDQALEKAGKDIAEQARPHWPPVRRRQ